MAVSRAQPELDLIEAAQRGDAEAFGALYDCYADRVHRHIFYRVGSRTDAEDLTQQTFLKAWRAMSRYTVTDVPFVAWLLTIAHNSVISHFRARRDTMPLDLEGFDPAAPGGPHDEVERRYDQVAVRRAIAQLKPDQQQVVALRYLEELDYRDVARLMGKSEANVRVILHRALKRLHVALEPTR